MNVLFHASHVGNLESIRDHGLVPQHGEIVQGTEMYQVYDDQDSDDWGERRELEEVIFLGADPGYVNWQVGNYLGKPLGDVTLAEIAQYGLVAVVRKGRHDEDIYCRTGMEEVMRWDGEEDMHIDDMPSHIESEDCFSASVITPDELIMGEDLIPMLQKLAPHQYQMATKAAERAELSNIQRRAGIDTTN